MRLCRVISVVFLLAAGCTPSPSRGLADDDAAFKIPAIKQAVASDDKAAAAQLIEDLDSDDPAVRFYAIEGLRRLTGQTMGYRYYDHEPERREAIARWRQWWEQQQGETK